MTLKNSRARMCALTAALGLLAICPSAFAAPKFVRLDNDAGGALPTTVAVRTSDGFLHVLYPTSPQRGGVDGLATLPISSTGKIGPTVQALSGWQAGIPGFVTSGPGQLAAFFGAISPPPGNVSSVWAINSSDGGATWAAPADVKSSSNEALAYGSDITARLMGSTPVLTVPQAGNLIIQQGLGPTSSTYQLNDASNGSLGGVESAVDASTGQVVVSWQSIAGNPTEFIDTAAPSPGTAQPVPGQSKPTIVLAGRDSGAGVFGAYTTDNTHVDLLRYGGGSVKVGKAKNINAKTLGVATGPSGRIWVMWGSDNVGGGVAVTRSNMAVTKFEPIQRLKLNSGSLYSITGDGRLGPLDLLVDQIPNTSPIQSAGAFYTHALPVLSASASVTKVKKKGKVTSFIIVVKVTDAGDPVKAAAVTGAGKAATNAKGIAVLKVPASFPGPAKLTVTKPDYQTLRLKVKL
jgi:hypothetical protein